MVCCVIECCCVRWQGKERRERSWKLVPAQEQMFFLSSALKNQQYLPYALTHRAHPPTPPSTCLHALALIPRGVGRV